MFSARTSWDRTQNLIAARLEMLGRRGTPPIDLAISNPADCGLAPGMVNILAEYGIQQLDSVDSVRIFVGGLPQHPEPPLNYQIVYSLEESSPPAHWARTPPSRSASSARGRPSRAT